MYHSHSHIESILLLKVHCLPGGSSTHKQLFSLYAEEKKHPASKHHHRHTCQIREGIFSLPDPARFSPKTLMLGSHRTPHQTPCDSQAHKGREQQIQKPQQRVSSGTQPASHLTLISTLRTPPSPVPQTAKICIAQPAPHCTVQLCHWSCDSLSREVTCEPVTSQRLSIQRGRQGGKHPAFSWEETEKGEEEKETKEINLLNHNVREISYEKSYGSNCFYLPSFL